MIRRTVLLAALIALWFSLVALQTRNPVVATPAATSTCALGQKLADLKLYDQAISAFVDVLKANPSTRCAAIGIRSVLQAQAQSASGTSQKSSSDPCQVADSLESLGYDSDARSEYMKALPDALKAGSSCAENGLKKGLWERAGNWVQRWAPRIAMFLALALLGLALIPALPIGDEGRRRYRSFLSRFGPTRWLFRPRLVLAPFTSDASEAVGPSVGSMVRAELIRLRVAEDVDELFDPAVPMNDVLVVTGFEDVPDVLSGITDISNPLKYLSSLAGLVQKILPFTRITIDGVLDAGTGRGAGVTLTLEDQKLVSRGATLWQQSVTAAPVTATPTADDYYQLVPQAAGWIYHTLSNVIVGGAIPVTASAESYAKFRAGLARQEGGHYEDARAMYMEALELDPLNWAALANLGMVAAYENDGASAIDFLLGAVITMMDAG